jgi:hypothetical protein
MIKAWFLKAKLWLIAAAGVAFSALLIALKIRTAQRDEAREERDIAQARADHAAEVITHDAEVDIQVDERLAEVARGDSDELTRPNDWE